MEGPRAAAGGDVSLHNFSARLWEQLVHFHVMRLTDSLFLWVGATPHLRNLAVAMCSRYVSAGGRGRRGSGKRGAGETAGAGPGRRERGLGRWDGEGAGARGGLGARARFPPRRPRVRFLQAGGRDPLVSRARGAVGALQSSSVMSGDGVGPHQHHPEGCRVRSGQHVGPPAGPSSALPPPRGPLPPAGPPTLRAPPPCGPRHPAGPATPRAPSLFRFSRVTRPLCTGRGQTAFGEWSCGSPSGEEVGVLPPLLRAAG
ncbi:hypothetical protein QTO34_018219 [Cnephaeus nilssonii]|uniref:Proteasome assembly chaperone 4 n=1 Tax=Cnephaeus nilssonii TaxID=3371016 RepID=A0AA40HZ78_CNENI|nr:hypothetical protein QTO34_018219 [Eptesicus nilssonii]